MEEDRRRHKRLPLRLSVLCRKVGFPKEKMISGKTVDVSPGGMLIKISDGAAAVGELLSVEMSVPPTEGLLDFGGMLSNYARVVRFTSTETLGKTMALEFCDLPTLRN